MRLAPPRGWTLALVALVALIAPTAGASAQVWTPVGPADAPVVSLDGDPAAGGHLLAAVDGTLYLSEDEGASWTPVLSGEISEVAVSPADPSRVYALARHQHVYRSDDGGLTWEPSLSLTADHHMVGLWSDPVDPDVAYFSTIWVILFTEDPTYLYRTADGGITWEPVLSSILATVDDVGFGSGLEPAHLGLFSTFVVRSEDGGLTWALLAPEGLDGVTLGELAGDPATAGRFLASTWDGELLESTDSGDSWHPYGAGLPGGAFLRLLFDRASPETVYAATQGRGIFRSVDGGATWAPVGTGAPADRPTGVLDLALNGEPQRLFAGTDHGVLAARPDLAPPCLAGPATLCLQGGRFEARVAWQDFQGGAGEGRAIPLTDDTGSFWFFRDTNLELAVKVLNGSAVNGFYWNFYGSLSNVPFTLTLRDSVTGEQRFYVNPERVFASRGDTRGFPAISGTERAGLAAAPPTAPADEPARAVPATGTAGGWTPVGPDGGPIWALLPRAGDPETVLAGSGASGIFRSADGGDTWTLLPDSPASAAAEPLELHEGPDGLVYVLHFDGSVYRSPDGGGSWIRCPDPPGDFHAGTLAVDPLTPGVVYAGAFDGLRKSVDAGRTWQRVESFPPNPDPFPGFLGVDDLTFDAAGETLWAATFQGAFRSPDGGATWVPANGGLTGDARRVETLAAVPGVPERLYAATDGGIYETLDGGDSWILRGPSPVILVYDLVVDPADPAHLWTRSFDPLHESRDRGATWEPVGALPDPIYAVTADPRGNGTVYAGSDLGVHRSRDGGATWELVDDGLHARDVADLAAHPGVPDRLLAASREGIFRSADGGAGWTRTLTPPIYALALGEADLDTLFAAGEHGIHRSRDGGLTWEPATAPGQLVFNVWAHPADSDAAFAAGVTPIPFGPDPVWVSRTLDGGETWERVWNGAEVAIYDLEVGPAASQEPGTALLSTGDGNYRSTDGGAGFEPAGDQGLGDLAVVDLIADPLQAGRFLGSAAGGTGAESGVYETTDAGDTWRRFGSDLPPGATPRLHVDPTHPEVYFAAADGLGAFRSADRGATWQPTGGDGPYGRPTGALRLGLTGDPLRLHAATLHGVWSTPASPGTAPGPCVPGPTALCLQGGRFRVEVAWQDFDGGAGAGQSHPLTGDTGAFWFFDDANLELFVKVLDGTPVNGRYWVFYGSLSNVPFTLTVTDTATGEPRVYENPERVFASRGDTAAF